MSTTLRIILLTVSSLTTIYVFRKIRKSQIQIEDTIFWLSFSSVFILLSLFPRIAIYIATAFGISSTANFIFLSIIFILLMKLFLLSIKVSHLESRLRSLAREVAIREQLQRDALKDCLTADKV